MIKICEGETDRLGRKRCYGGTLSGYDRCIGEGQYCGKERLINVPAERTEEERRTEKTADVIVGVSGCDFGCDFGCDYGWDCRPIILQPAPSDKTLDQCGRWLIKTH